MFLQTTKSFQSEHVITLSALLLNPQQRAFSLFSELLCLINIYARLKGIMKISRCPYLKQVVHISTMAIKAESHSSTSLDLRLTPQSDKHDFPFTPQYGKHLFRQTDMTI